MNVCEIVHSLSVKQAVTKKTVNGYLVNFLDGDFDGIFDPAVGDGVCLVVPDDITCPLVVVTRLADRADVKHGLGIRLNRVGHFEVGRRVEFAIFRKNAGNMCVTLKRTVRHNGEKAVHFTFVENIFLKNVLIQRVSWTAVNEKEIVMPMGTGQSTEKIPASVGLGVMKILKLVACPENCLFRSDVEAFRVEKRCLVVVTE